MNWFIRFGQWWFERRPIREREFQDTLTDMRLKFEKEIRDLKKSQETPDKLLTNARLDKIELWVGLKREPTPSEVKGAARIS